MLVNLILIMSLTRNNLYYITTNSIHQPIHIINPTTPKPTHIFLQWFWFPNTIKISSLNIFQQYINTLSYFLILCLPVDIILPCLIKPNLFHSSTSIISCSTPFPALRASTPLCKCAILLSE